LRAVRVAKRFTILIVDDEPNDRALVIRILEKEFREDLKVIEVFDPRGLERAIREKQFDLVITDYRLRWSNGIEILKLIKAYFPDCPVIMNTGSGSEEIAVEAMKIGLDDYVIKSYRHLSRLPVAVREALKKYERIKKANEVERRYRELVENIAEVIYSTDREGIITYISPAVKNFGYEPEEVIGHHFAKLTYEKDTPLVERQFEKVRSGDNTPEEFRILTKSQAVRWVRSSLRPIFRNGKLIGLYGILTDVTEPKKIQELLSRGKKEWEATFDAITDPIMIVNRDYTIQRVNYAFIRRLKLNFSDVIGKPCYQIVHPEGKRPLNCPLKGPSHSYPAIVTLGGLNLPGSYLCSIYVLDFEGEELFIHYFRDITKEKEAEEMLRKLNWKILKAQEEERKKIAQELHDQLAQDLAYLRLNVSRLRGSYPERDQELFVKLMDLVDNLIEKIRRISYQLRPVALERFGLATALEKLAEEFTKTSEIKCRIDLQIDDDQIPRRVVLPAYRIIAEALTNVIKHAKATEVVIQIQREDDRVVFNIIDNGIGIQRGIELQSLGLLGMLERARSVGGDLQIGPGPICGTVVTALLPCHD